MAKQKPYFKHGSETYSWKRKENHKALEGHKSLNIQK